MYLSQGVKSTRATAAYTGSLGLGFRVQGLEFRVQGLGSRV